MIDSIASLLTQCDSPDRISPPTDLYTEGWMLRLVLDWFSKNPEIDHLLSFSKSDKWYSEALLPSAFLARYRGDKLAESWTHADGAIGDIAIGVKQDGGLTLTDEAPRFIVTEAKMFSKLSSGVTNVRYYNQAAMNVSCIAEVIKRANIPADRVLVPRLAPEIEEQISSMVAESLEKKQESEQFLNQAKSRVEQLTEKVVKT